jgi:hypothetical protein
VSLGRALTGLVTALTVLVLAALARVALALAAFARTLAGIASVAFAVRVLVRSLVRTVGFVCAVIYSVALGSAKVERTIAVGSTGSTGLT